MSAQSTTRKPKILIVTASVGVGHNSSACAIIAELKQWATEIETEYRDVLEFTPRKFRMFYAGGYALAVTKLPFLYGVGYRITDRPKTARRTLMERRRLWSERRAMKRFADYLLQFQPDLIVSTHFLAPPMIGRLIEQGQLNSRQMIVVTDNDPHRYWYAENVDHWFIPAEFLAERLEQWGISQEKITVSGIPIHSKWNRSLERKKVFAEWNLPTDKRIVLLSGGADFTCGPIIRIARSIVNRCEDSCVVVLGGNNKKLLARVARLSKSKNRIVGVSFTDRVNELVDICPLMVTKAGGVTTAECLAKGTPMVLLKPIPGQEANNAAYFQREGAAVVAPRAKDVADMVCQLLENKAMLSRLANNARRLYRPATETIAECICQRLDINEKQSQRGES